MLKLVANQLKSFVFVTVGYNSNLHQFSILDVYYFFFKIFDCELHPSDPQKMKPCSNFAEKTRQISFESIFQLLKTSNVQLGIMDYFQSFFA